MGRSDAPPVGRMGRYTSSAGCRIAAGTRGHLVGTVIVAVPCLRCAAPSSVPPWRDVISVVSTAVSLVRPACVRSEIWPRPPGKLLADEPGYPRSRRPLRRFLPTGAENTAWAPGSWHADPGGQISTTAWETAHERHYVLDDPDGIGQHPRVLRARPGCPPHASGNVISEDT